MTRILLLTVLGLLGVGSLAAADGEYSYSNGYYWKGNDAYTRSYYTSPGYYGQGYYYCGRYYPGVYYPGSSYYQYSYAYTKQSAAKVPAYTPNWKSELIQYAKSRDDQQAYLSALKAMGLNGQTYEFQQASYAKSYGAYPAQGDTVYGYTYSQLQHAYGETNMNTLYQQSARLTQGAQSLAGQANSEFAGLVQQAGDNQLRLAEYFAKAQAIAIAAKAVEPQPQSVTQTTVQGGGVVAGKSTGGSQVEQTTASGSASQGTGSVAAAGDGNGGDFMAKVARPLCASCHSTKDPAGKFDIETYPSLTAEQKASVWERLTTTDASKRMPRNVKDRTKPGEPLTAAQLAEFFKH